jgi:hypothetical protein
MIGKAIATGALGVMGGGVAAALGGGFGGALGAGAFKTGVNSLISGQSPGLGSIGSIAASALGKGFNPMSFFGGGG